MPPRGGGGQPPRSLEWERGTVKQVNEFGLKLTDDNDWRNWSQYGPKPNERPTITVGQRVKLGQDKDGFIREIRGPNDEDLTADGTTGGTVSSGRFTEGDSWRMTLLSCLSTAARWLPEQTLEIQEAARQNRDDPEHPIAPSQAVYRLAVSWATKAWREPVPKPPQPAPVEPEQ